jgi:hypothetical protein
MNSRLAFESLVILKFLRLKQNINRHFLFFCGIFDLASFMQGLVDAGF